MKHLGHSVFKLLPIRELLCLAGGFLVPGLWGQASLPTSAPQPLAFFRLAPCRVADTRVGSGFSSSFGPPFLAGGSTRSFPIPTSGCNVPATAQAYSLNITVVPHGGLGYLTAWPTGLALPVAATLNSLDGRIVGNAAIVPAGTAGAISLFASNDTDVVIDIHGYFGPPAAPQPLAFYPVTPCRVADTRSGSGFMGAFGPPSLAGGAPRDFPLLSSACAIPSSAQAYSVRMTVVAPGPLGYLTTWPAGQPFPVAATLNALNGGVVGNEAIVPAGSSGAISVFASNNTDLVIDINGYFAPPGSPGALYFYPLTPCRVADTRSGSGFSGAFGPPSLMGGATRDFPMPTSSCGIPSSAQAYSLNMTVVASGGVGYLTAWQAGQALPIAATLNALNGGVVGGGAIVPTGTSGAISVFASNPTDLVIDASGYFAPSTAGYLLPLKASSNNRYLVDQNAAPFLIMGDAPQSIVGHLSPGDMTTYMVDRQRLGFNTLWVNLLCEAYTSCNSDGTTYDGVAPFTSGSSPLNYDLSTPNSAYFSRVDSMLNLALNYNFVVFLDPISTGGWMGTLENNGTTKAYNYGAYLGNRYKNFTNIVWLHGNDFQTWSSNGTDNNLVMQVMAGIASVDTNHLQTIELNYPSSYSNQDSALGSLLTLDSAYTYGETYDIILKSYNSSPTIPVYLAEADYEYENLRGALPGPTGPYVLREQAYWTVLSGGAGQIYGNHYMWTFTPGWQAFLDSPGALEIQYINQLFGSVSWWNLVPDTAHAVVTAGYGAYNGSNQNLTIANYCTTGWITNGSLALTYCPQASTLTVNLGAFSGPVTAQWYDPTYGTYTTISGSPFQNSGSRDFTTPGQNNLGDPDWVLVLHR
jgi:hypothetical protein